MITERKPLKIGISCYPSVGGSGVVATMLGVELARLSHEVHFISYEHPFRLPPKEPRTYFHKVDVNSYDLFKYPDYTLPLSVEMARISNEYNLDILHVHYAVPHATAASLAMCMLPERKRPRVVTTLHGTDTTLLGADPGYGPAILHALKQSDCVTTVSEFLRAETLRVVGFEGRMRVIHNFFNPNSPTRTITEVRSSLGLKETDMVILHSSNLRAVKRINLLLQVVASLDKSIPFKLLILAGGSFEPYRETIKKLCIEERIVVLENILDIENYIQIADISLYTSESESFCLSILEAMFFGCPSISTAVGGIPEVLRDKIDGILVDETEHDKLAAMLTDLLSNHARRKRMGESALLRAKQNFSTDVIVPLYEMLYYELCEPNLEVDSSTCR